MCHVKRICNKDGKVFVLLMTKNSYDSLTSEKNVELQQILETDEL
jgi:hypothetical protein